MDKIRLDNVPLSPCYALVTSDCASASPGPVFAVFVRRMMTGTHRLAVKVHVGGHTVEILPDESGRRKQLSVKANDLDVDVQNSTYSLPDLGTSSKAAVLTVRYQSPVYVISSPGAGLLIHYSGSHVAVYPSGHHKKRLCGLCGNFDGEPDRTKEWTSLAGCALVPDDQQGHRQLAAAFTLGGQRCVPDQEKALPTCDSQ